MVSLYKKVLVIGLLTFIPLVNVLAHQPNYVSDQKSISVIEPEISKAYYGELVGEKVIYTISAQKDFDLYVNVLVPDITDAKKNISAKIIKNDGNEIATLNGDTYEWIRWYEEFAGDWYWQGPEFKERVSEGKYTIEVYNNDNTGKYILAVGEIEKFGLSNSIETFDQLIQVKQKTFEKPWFTAFTNKIGLFAFIPLLIVFVIITIIILVWKKKK